MVKTCTVLCMVIQHVLTNDGTKESPWRGDEAFACNSDWPIITIIINMIWCDFESKGASECGGIIFIQLITIFYDIGLLRCAGVAERQLSGCLHLSTVRHHTGPWGARGLLK